MRTKQALAGVLLIAFAQVGCIADGTAPDDTLTLEARSMRTPQTNCYSSGGTTYCRDYYSGKWCTASQSQNVGVCAAWDYTGCTWTGYSDVYVSSGGTADYCKDGWSTWLGHQHCPP